MPTSDSAGAPSLLPYLSPHAPGIAFELDLAADPVTPGQLIAGDPCGPFTTLRAARIGLNGGGLLGEVALLCQADTYLLGGSELAPLANPDVEQAWQRAWGDLNKDPGAVQSPTGITLLPGQADERGLLVSLKPLFFCRHTARFGHPHCPFCGHDLVLCRDDLALEKAGLPTFGGSLQRFLHCPDCHRVSDDAPFYQHILPADAPARLQGCAALIEDFSRLLAKTELAGDLPCIGCGEATQCYGADTLVLKRMAAVQFYPFHMLILKTPALNALDFLPLIAGATREAVEQSLARSQQSSRLKVYRNATAGWSTGSGFLFAGDKRLFAEVLYLKLAFLHELFLLVMGGAAEPVNRLSMEGIGVGLAGQGARLPYLWNFTLTLIDPVGRPVHRPTQSKASQGLAREFLGLAWFYVLLVNSRQPMEKVRTVIDRFPEGMDNGQEAEALLSDPVFSPGNIFWQAPILDSRNQWASLWNETLGLGARLLLPGWKAEQAEDLQAFGRRLENLKERVHRDLFQAGSDAPSDQQTSDKQADMQADIQIAQILTSLLEQWTPPDASRQAQADPRQADRKGPTATSGARPNKDGDYQETVILSDRGIADRHGDVPSTEPTLEKTVLISPQAGQKRPGPAPDLEKTGVLSSPPADRRLEKTVVIPAPDGPPPPADPDKTVVIDPQSKPLQASELEETVAIGRGQAPGAEDVLEETVVLRPGGLKPSAGPGPITAAPSPKSPSQVNGVDDLEATVLQKPGSAPKSAPKAASKAAGDRKPKP